MRRSSLIFLAGLLVLAAALRAAPAEAQHRNQADNPPERGLSAAFNYPGVIVGPAEKARLEISVANTGRRADTFMVRVLEKPAGWNTELTNYNTQVTGLFLSPEAQTNLILAAFPEERPDFLPPGDYLFRVEIASRDGELRTESECLLSVAEKKKAAELLKLTTSFPMLKGPNTQRFSFAFDLRNDAGEDVLANLSAEAPPGWEVTFKPGFEDKQISSLQLPKGQSRSVNMDVWPPPQAEAGRYPLKLTAQTADSRAQADLTVELTGTYKIKAVTANELLSTTTRVGRPVVVSLYVRNEGSARQNKITFLTLKPENWQVKFNPEEIIDLGGEKPLAQVDMTIIPGPGALVGDYSVGVTAKGEKASSDLEFRVTVQGSAAWAWVGLLIIALVVAGLGLTFYRLGRR